MKQIKTVLCAGFVLGIGLMTSSAAAQTFTFSTIAGGSQGSNDGVGTDAQFSTPADLAVDAAGNIYVADEANNAIRKITPFGTDWIVTTVAGGTRGSQDGTNGTAQFSGPSGIAVDSASNLYVADQFNYTIRKISPVGTNWAVTTIAGQVGVSGTNNGTNLSAKFYNPASLAIDPSGNLFVADEFNNSIREIMPEGSNWVVRTIAGGTRGLTDGTNDAAQFYDPSGIAVGSNDQIFVADQFNNSIRLVTPSGSNWIVTTIAGQPVAGSSNGVGTNAQFTAPVGLAVDTNGNVYVADEFDNAIRELTPDGSNWLVSTIGGGTVGTANGVGTNAQFYLPFGVAADGYGDIFVTDSKNNAIRLGVSSSAAPDVGTLQVNLTPTAAVTGGAQWQVDGGPLQVTDATLTNLTPGTHVLGFSAVSGLTTPAPQYVTITAHQTTTTTGNYATAIANAGSLEVLISPQSVVNAGAQWQVDGGPLQSNGAVVADLSVGTHTVSFDTITGWTTPADQSVVITNSATTLALGTYVSQTGVGSLQVTILPADVVTAGAQWQVDGGTWQNNNAIVPNLAVGAHTIYFSTVSGWLTPANQIVSVSDGALATATATYVVAPNYTVTVTAAPTNGGTVSGTGIFAEGTSNTITATANSGYEFIGWAGAATGAENSQTIVVNTNLNLTAYFAPAGSTILYLVTNGSGTISPKLNGKTLNPKLNYSLRATPGAKNVFAGWTGTITTNKNPLTFKTSSSIVLQANFIATPYPPFVGTYNGLFSTTNGVTVQTAGMLKSFVVRSTGTYSGTLEINGAAHALSGTFNVQGLASNRVTQASGLGDLFVDLALVNTTNYGPQVTGVVHGTNGTAWAASLMADLGTNTRGTVRYTMLVPPDSSNAPPALAPGGDGYASIIEINGSARLAGALADGTAFSESVPVSQSGYVPVYASLYTRQGLLLGWINLNSTNSVGVGLTWTHPKTTKGLYQNGFTNVILTNQILLSPWTIPPANLNLLTNLALADTIDDTNSSNFAVSTSSKGAITSQAGVTGSINASTGVFRVTIGTGAHRMIGYGAVLPNARIGGGYVLTTNGQAVLLQP